MYLSSRKSRIPFFRPLSGAAGLLSPFFAREGIRASFFPLPRSAGLVSPLALRLPLPTSLLSPSKGNGFVPPLQVRASSPFSLRREKPSTASLPFPQVTMGGEPLFRADARRSPLLLLFPSQGQSGPFSAVTAPSDMHRRWPFFPRTLDWYQVAFFFVQKN